MAKKVTAVKQQTQRPGDIARAAIATASKNVDELEVEVLAAVEAFEARTGLGVRSINLLRASGATVHVAGRALAPEPIVRCHVGVSATRGL